MFMVQHTDWGLLERYISEISSEEREQDRTEERSSDQRAAGKGRGMETTPSHLQELVLCSCHFVNTDDLGFLLPGQSSFQSKPPHEQPVCTFTAPPPRLSRCESGKSPSCKCD